MKDIKKLAKETWKFYLGVLAVVLLFILCDSIYQCQEYRFQYGGQIFTYELGKAEAKAFQSKADYIYGADLTGIIADKATGDDVLGFLTILFILSIALVIRYFAFMGGRSREFELVLPVKKVTRVLYDYSMFALILLVGGLLQLSIFLAYQSNYNNKIAEALQVYKLGELKENAVSMANERLLCYMGSYFLFAFFIFTIIFLGVQLCKNPILGGAIAFSIWGITAYNMEQLIWDIPYLGDEEDWRAGLACINPAEFFNRMTVNQGKIVWGGNNSIIIPILLVGCVILIVCISMAAKCKDESKGKLFYFLWLDYPFALFCGLCIFLAWCINCYVSIPALMVCFVLSIVICLFIHPLSHKQQEKWRVK